MAYMNSGHLLPLLQIGAEMNSFTVSYTLPAGNRHTSETILACCHTAVRGEPRVPIIREYLRNYQAKPA